jgi:hypothetical protein
LDTPGRQRAGVVEHLCAAKPHLRHCPAPTISGVHLEHMLMSKPMIRISMECLLLDGEQHRLPTWHRRRWGAGAVHPINGRMRDELLNETLILGLSTTAECRDAAVLEVIHDTRRRCTPFFAIEPLRPLAIPDQPFSSQQDCRCR